MTNKNKGNMMKIFLIPLVFMAILISGCKETSSSIEKQVDDLLLKTPSGDAEILEYSKEAFQVIKKGFKTSPENVQKLNEKALVKSRDPAFLLIKMMHHFRVGAYDSTLNYAQTFGLAHGKSNFIDAPKPHFMIYMAAASSEQSRINPNQPKPNEKDIQKFKDLLKEEHPGVLYYLPEPGEDYDHMVLFDKYPPKGKK